MRPFIRFISNILKASIETDFFKFLSIPITQEFHFLTGMSEQLLDLCDRITADQNIVRRIVHGIEDLDLHVVSFSLLNGLSWRPSLSSFLFRHVSLTI